MQQGEPLSRDAHDVSRIPFRFLFLPLSLALFVAPVRYFVLVVGLEEQLLGRVAALASLLHLDVAPELSSHVPDCHAQLGWHLAESEEARRWSVSWVWAQEFPDDVVVAVRRPLSRSECVAFQV
ncbi:hypothetical protein PG989_005438 [Apiospora arundinis]